MAHKLRVETPGFYHVISRGNNKQPIFDDMLRSFFLPQLGWVAGDFGWNVYGWALMTNHFHLLLQVGELGLAKGMHRLNLGFAIASNARFGRINHCVGDRYWSTPIESDAHLFASVRYVVWNPVRAGVVGDPADSSWTSYRPSAGIDPAPRALALTRLLEFFGRAPLTAHDRFREFVESGRDRCLAPFGDGTGIVR